MTASEMDPFHSFHEGDRLSRVVLEEEEEERKKPVAANPKQNTVKLVPGEESRVISEYHRDRASSRREQTAKIYRN
jgi:hypothetical protein